MAFRDSEGGAKLKGVGGPQRMNAKKADRTLADDLAWFDLVSTVGEFGKPVESQRSPFLVEGAGALETGQSRGALDFRPPPDQHVGVALCELLQAPRRGFMTSGGRRAPKTSPSVAAFFDQGPERRSAGVGVRGLAREKRTGRGRAGRPYEAVANEPR